MHKWSQHINEDNIEMALFEWAESLAGIPPEAIKEAIKYCKNNLEWPPSIAEFRRYCKKSQGLPTVDEILKQGIDRNFNNPVTKIVFDRIGSWAFSHDSEKELRDKIKKEIEFISNDKSVNNELKGLSHGSEIAGDNVRGNGVHNAKAHVLS